MAWGNRGWRKQRKQRKQRKRQEEMRARRGALNMTVTNVVNMCKSAALTYTIMVFVKTFYEQILMVISALAVVGSTFIMTIMTAHIVLSFLIWVIVTTKTRVVYCFEHVVNGCAYLRVIVGRLIRNVQSLSTGLRGRHCSICDNPAIWMQRHENKGCYKYTCAVCATLWVESTPAKQTWACCDAPKRTVDLMPCEDDALAKWRLSVAAWKKPELSRGEKPCPTCGIAIYRVMGCAHMTCSQCGYSFCWNCGNYWVIVHDCRHNYY